MVCLAEQPLHSVPLLKFTSLNKPEGGNKYTIPQWINLSYYSRHYKSSVFVPRIQVPQKSSEEIGTKKLFFIFLLFIKVLFSIFIKYVCLCVKINGNI